MKFAFFSSLIAFTQLLSASAFAAPEVLAPETVLASTARMKVTYADLQAELARIPEKDQFEFLMNRQRLGTVVENMLINKTLAQEARELGLDKQPKVRQEIENQTDKVLAKYRGQDIQKKVKVPDLSAKVKETYITSDDRYRRPAQYDTWHVLIDLKGRTREGAMARAEEVRQKLLGGAKAEELASTYSNDTSAYHNKGRLGFNRLEIYDPAYAAVVKKMTIGEVSKVVESPFGFHVIKLHGIIPESKVSFEEAKAELTNEATESYVASIWENHINGIRGDKTLKVNVDALELVRPKVPEIPKAVPPPVKATDSK